MHSSMIRIMSAAFLCLLMAGCVPAYKLKPASYMHDLYGLNYDSGGLSVFDKESGIGFYFPRAIISEGKEFPIGIYVQNLSADPIKVGPSNISIRINAVNQDVIGVDELVANYIAGLESRAAWAKVSGEYNAMIASRSAYAEKRGNFFANINGVNVQGNYRQTYYDQKLADELYARHVAIGENNARLILQDAEMVIGRIVENSFLDSDLRTGEYVQGFISIYPQGLVREGVISINLSVGAVRYEYEFQYD